MSLSRLVLKNIIGNAFRSVMIFLCATLVAGLALTATFVVRGAEGSLRHNLKRMGADIIVLPWGTMTEKLGGVRLMSAAIDGWMPRAVIEQVAAVDGVEQVAPQLYMATVRDSPYCALPEMHLVAYDPVTDFTLDPWIQGKTAHKLGPDEAIAGAHITIPDGGDFIALFGHQLTLRDRLEPTATSIDSTLFVSFETAERMIAWSQGQAKGELDIMPGSISAIMVRVGLNSDPHDVSVEILERVPSVVPLETPHLFQTERRQMIGVLRTLLSLLSIIWVLTLIFMGLVFSVAANERRWDIGVLRALGLPRTFVLKALLMEGAALALVGGFIGVIVAVAGFAFLGDQAVRVVRLPLQFPTPLSLLSLSLAGQTVALVSVTLAAFFPAWRISHEEVALSMRE